MKRYTVPLFWISFLLLTSARGEEWPHWRGPQHNGSSIEVLNPAGSTIQISDPLWKRAIGEGCSSLAVADQALNSLSWQDGKDTLWCLDTEDGAVRWSQSYPAPRYGRFAVGDQNFFSGPIATPTFDAEMKHLYTLGCDGELRCWNTAKKGELVWSLNLYERYKIGRRPDTGGGQRDYGFTAAPLVHGNALLVMVGGQAGLVVALDKSNGEQLWASEYQGMASHSGGLSPIQVDGIDAVCALSLNHLVLIRTDEGHEGMTAGTYPWKTEFANNIVTPTVLGRQILLSSGYNISRTVLLDVNKGQLLKKWEARPHTCVCSPVVYDGNIFFASRNLYSLKVSDGTSNWQGGRFGDDASCVATANGYLVVWGDTRLAIVDARTTTAYKEVAVRNNVAGKNQAWPHVVFVNGRIFTRDRRGNITCYAIQNPPADKE